MLLSVDGICTVEMITFRRSSGPSGSDFCCLSAQQGRFDCSGGLAR